MSILQVKLAFMDDRKTKMLRDEREKAQREARATTSREAEMLSEVTPSSSMTSPRTMSLGDESDGPPPYEVNNDV